MQFTNWQMWLIAAALVTAVMFAVSLSRKLKRDEFIKHALTEMLKEAKDQAKDIDYSVDHESRTILYFGRAGETLILKWNRMGFMNFAGPDVPPIKFLGAAIDAKLRHGTDLFSRAKIIFDQVEKHPQQFTHAKEAL